MTMILEFPLEITDFQTVKVPLHSTTILGVQPRGKKIVLSILGDEFEDGDGWLPHELKLRIISANTKFERNGLRFIGSFKNGDIWNLFEQIVRENAD